MEGFSALQGQTILAISGATPGSEEIQIRTVEGLTLKMYHSQDCCESVLVEDVCGNIENLIGEKVLLAEEVSSENSTPASVNHPGGYDSYTWTFYKLGTMKGYVVIRWLGESNGYYSESVDCEWSRE